jgi:hypothetical protein
MTKRTTIGFLIFAASLAPTIAHAQEGDVQRAQALFDEGKTLFEAENFSAACPKLAESKELAPGIGVTLYLATCEETIGLRATALSYYREAETMAHARGDGREAIAHAYVTRLETQTPRIRIRLPNGSSKIAVTDNGHTVSTNSTRGFAVDPGPHKIRATGDHNEEWIETVHVPTSADGVDGGTFEVNVPQLDGTNVPTATQDAPSKSSNGVAQKGIAIGVGALGVVGIGLGTYLGLHAKSLQDESNGVGGGCNASDKCDAHGQDLRMSAIGSATASTVLFLVGCAAVVTGVVLYVVSPSSSHNDVGVALGPSNASLIGSF